MNKQNILAIKHGALGDIILATAAFAAIRKHHADARITLLTTKPYAALLAQSPYFDEILIDPKPKLFQFGKLLALIRLLRSKPWAWVYDLQTSSRTTRYQWLLKRPWPNISNASRFSSHPRPGYDISQHSLDNLRDQLAVAGVIVGAMPDVSWLKEEGAGDWGLEAGSVVPPPLRGRLGGGALDIAPSSSSPPPNPPRKGEGLPVPYALLIPGGAAHRPEKRWPADRYAALAEALVTRNITPVLIGTHAEAEALDAIAAEVPKAIHLGGKTSIAQLADLARGAAFAVGNDTGPMHLIAATNCPSTVIFSAASSPTRSRPLGKYVTVLQSANLHDLSVERVLASLTVPT
jgi:ADP-heptose:LPS heptosyltransferase